MTHDERVVLDLGWIQVLKATSHSTSRLGGAKATVGCQVDRAVQVHNGPQTSQVVLVRCWRTAAQAVARLILVFGVAADTRWYEKASLCGHVGRLARPWSMHMTAEAAADLVAAGIHIDVAAAEDYSVAEASRTEIAEAIA
jgi:hypothetical protein